MSISTMTNVAIARRMFAARVPAKEGSATTAPSTDTALPASQATSALAVVTAYIPTEILTLYVGARAALTQVASRKPDGSVETLKAGVDAAEWVAFSTATLVTPIVVWLVYAAKVRASGKPLPLKPGEWPVWEMFSATVAYWVWAFALPNSPFGQLPWYSPAIAGLAVLVVSMVLGLVAPVVGSHK